MKKGYNTQLTRQIGEHLVVAKLGRMGIVATPFAGNVPEYDLLASDASGRALPLQVKTINGSSWQFSSVTSFLDIEFVGNRQIVKGKKRLTNPSLIFVLVLLRPDERDEFYVLRKRVLQDYFFAHYRSGERPKNPRSTHCAIRPKELSTFRDRWDLITRRLERSG